MDPGSAYSSDYYGKLFASFPPEMLLHFTLRLHNFIFLVAALFCSASLMVYGSVRISITL